jgi:amino acid transporter
MDVTIIIGFLGALMILLAFIMNQLHKWKEDYLIYDLVNLIGSLFLVIYAIILVSYPFLILNLVWLMLSLRDVVVDLKRSSPRKKHLISKWVK